MRQVYKDCLFVFGEGIGGVGLLDTYTANSYNIFSAEVAQSVEHCAENAGVPSSILGLGTSGINRQPLTL